jgi:SNF2 family DNA or RNA helicase
VERPFLGNKEKFLSLPHLIVCPGTLVAQWVSELKVFLQPKSVDIFVYDGQTNGDDFWTASGLMHLSKHQPHSRIIVASHAVH